MQISKESLKELIIAAKQHNEMIAKWENFYRSINPHAADYYVETDGVSPTYDAIMTMLYKDFDNDDTITDIIVDYIIFGKVTVPNAEGVEEDFSDLNVILSLAGIE